MKAAVSKKAAEVLTKLAIALDLLEKKDLHWTAKGHVVNDTTPGLETVEQRFKQLSWDIEKKQIPFRFATLALQPREQIVYLKYFLDADGDIIINLLKQFGPDFLLGNKEQEEFLKGGGIEKVFEAVIDGYLSHVFELEPRHELNQLLRRVKKGYERHVQTHKFVPRMETLVDLGIIKKIVDGTVSYGSSSTNDFYTTKVFLQEFGDSEKLDSILSPGGEYFEKAAKVYRIEHVRVDENTDYELLKVEVVKAYEKVRDEVFRLAHLEAIMDSVCVNFLTYFRKLCKWEQIKKVIERMQKEAEKDIRFHVNDWGTISYITISESYVRTLLGGHTYYKSGEAH